MALDIETKTAYGHKWQSWRVGSHPATHDGIDVREVVSVSADGDELEKIRRPTATQTLIPRSIVKGAPGTFWAIDNVYNGKEGGAQG